MLLTFAMLLSTRLPAIASGAVCVVLFGLGWMAGVFAGIGRFFDAGPLGRVAEASRWLLPERWPVARDDLQPRAAGGRHRRAGPRRLGRRRRTRSSRSTPPSTAFIAWSIAWVVLVLATAAISLGRRDL